MEPAGWIILIVSFCTVIGLNIFCFYRVLTLPKEHMHAPLEIDTQDLADNGDNNNNGGNNHSRP
ncbi:MAG: hypothetical protein HPY51_20465 [Candidatus Omnitrophica bacterium]|nr:hypothetical protein [Candidatus Omnitrophota bacterium]